MDFLKRTHDIIQIQADPDLVYSLAAAVENWPKILPHYRWVKLIGDSPDGLVIEMAARRGCIPVKWRAVQRADPGRRRIAYRHIGGATRGMFVEWSIDALPDGTVRAEIMHELTLRTPIVNTWLGKFIVARVFIRHIAGRTLEQIKRRAEQEI